MLLIAALVGVFVFEVYRLRKNITFLGLRPHEKTQIASFAWAAGGVVVVLWLFEPAVASVAIVGVALIDPLLGELRRVKIHVAWQVLLPMAAYLVIALSVMYIAGDRQIWEQLAMAGAATLVAIPSEWFKIDYVDDDFLMLVAPAVAMAWLQLLL